MSKRVTYFNGEHVPEHEARVSIYDSALMFGDMAFEVTRTFAHQPFRLRQHLERLYASLRMLEINCGLSIDQMEQATLETLEKNIPTEEDGMDWIILHDISRGPLDFYRTAFAHGPCPTVIISCWPIITHMGSFAPSYDSGINMVVPSQRALPARMVDAKCKTRSRLHYQIANLQAARMGHAAWPVLIDDDGYLTEGTGANVFLVQNGSLLTPEPRNILRGVSRGTAIELAHKLNIPVMEMNLDRYEALAADEIFATSTSYCLVHAATFEDQVVGDGKVGPVARKIREAWKDLVKLDFMAQATAYAEHLGEWETQQAGDG